MKNNHEYYEMLISRYKDNDLNTDEIFEMEKHLSECKSCQKFKNELDSMSSILLGNNPIIVNKKNTFNKYKVIRYIGSVAAVLLLFFGISSIYNKPNNIISDDAKLIVSDLNDSIIKTSIDYNITEDDYAPLSSYFSYSDEENEGNETAGEISIMSAYIYYMGK
ncbi:zf-HC2 domain-containing protein [uncultured Brachyspira sp.]|uniref:zf-HC2 domain-containing protein n=1 Tax=uncultured Brachyspira sp. TaxID=221953 RepID=UPI00261E0FBC|nr:zf-HC2 domain-containing protein [uncultured Brachyspira sp.]